MSDNAAKREGLTRPFHFMVTFWGKRYRDYFVDLFLPSMLAPSNLPLLQAQDGHRFFIAAPREDWEAIRELPIMNRLRRHAEPRWIEVSGPVEAETSADAHSRYAAVIRHMQVCQRTVLEAGYDPSAYGSLHFPDALISDGMVASLLKSVRAGHQLVACPALRQVEEAVLADLHTWGLLSPDVRPCSTARELTIPPRRAADLAVRHLHPEMTVFEEGAPGQLSMPPFRYWHIPGGRGILLHTFFAIPVLMDYSVVPTDHTSCLDHDAVENIYMSANFRNCSAIHVVGDSDEFSMLTLTPEATNHAPPTEKRVSRFRWVSELRRLCNIREVMRDYAGTKRDVVRRELFRVPIRWHGGELDEVWAERERRIEALIGRAVGDYYSISRPPDRNRFPDRRTLLDYVASVDAFLLSASWTTKKFLSKSPELARRLWLVLCGDRAAKRWLAWRAQVLWRQLQGHTTHPPRPDVP